MRRISGIPADEQDATNDEHGDYIATEQRETEPRAKRIGAVIIGAHHLSPDVGRQEPADIVLERRRQHVSEDREDEKQERRTC